MDNSPVKGSQPHGFKRIEQERMDQTGRSTTTDRSDPGAAWMASFQSGNEDAFDRIVRHYQSGVFHFVLGTVSDRDRAEDLTQETFLRVYRARSRYEPSARFRTWLFTIAHRLGLNEIRSTRRRRNVFSEVVYRRGDNDEEDSFWNSVADDESESPEEIVQRKELDHMILRLLDTLPKNQRIAIELQRTQKFSYADIGGVLNLSPGAVKSLLVRAREKLKSKLSPYLQDR